MHIKSFSGFACTLILPFILFTKNSSAQFAAEQKKEDSLLKVVAGLKDDKQQYEIYRKIAEIYLGVDKDKEAAYLSKCMFIAEQTRDRRFMAKACLHVVNQWLDMGGLMDRYDNAIKIADRGIELSKEAQLNDYTALLLIKKAHALRSKADHANAVKCNEEAVNYADLSNNDSVRIVAEMSYANTLMAKDENLAAFKKYMMALNMAESGDDDDLKLSAYSRVATFYAKIEQNEKAKDYYSKTIALAKKLKDENAEIGAYQSLIAIYGEAKDFTSARNYLSILRDKVNKSSNALLKSRPLLSEVNLLFREDVNKVAAYLRQNPKIVSDLKQWGYADEANKALGIMYSLEKKNDSAEYYFAKSKKDMNSGANPISIIGWNQAYAMHLEKLNRFADAATYIEQNLLIAGRVQSLSLKKITLEVLDSLYYKAGNTQKVVTNKLMLFQVKDSLEKQQKAKDLLNIEIDLENKRNDRIAQLREETLRKKHNLQYMGITAAILALFVALAAMGRLRVKPMMIRALGFISFILLFEFIILLIDKPIHSITHGEPLPVLLIKIVIIAILLPLHHWLEHKVIHYLMRHKEHPAPVTAAANSVV